MKKLKKYKPKTLKLTRKLVINDKTVKCEVIEISEEKLIDHMAKLFVEKFI